MYSFDHIVCGLNKIKVSSLLFLGNTLQCAFEALYFGSTIIKRVVVAGDPPGADPRRKLQVLLTAFPL